MKKLIVALLLSCCLLTTIPVMAAEESTEVSTETEDTPVVVEQYNFESYTVSAITPWCDFKEMDGTLQIFPYYSSDKHINMKVILLSGIPFWQSLKTTYNNAVVQSVSGFSVMTLEDGRTFAFKDDGETGVIVWSEDLPSSYVIEVLQSVT